MIENGKIAIKTERGSVYYFTTSEFIDGVAGCIRELTADRDKWRDRCERLVGEYGSPDAWICQDEYAHFNDNTCKNCDKDVFEHRGYSFAQQIQKEIDDDAN